MFDRRILKMTKDELEKHLHFRKRQFVSKNKKGKGSYNRNDQKRELEEAIRDAEV